VTDYLTAEEVAALHDRHCGGSPLRDAGLLASAAARPQATVFGQDAYGSDLEKAAALLHSLARNHPWEDGNKRAAWLCTRVFLARNGYRYDPDPDAAVAFVEAVATGQYREVADIAAELVKFFR
jgi:death-on-curing protein